MTLAGHRRADSESVLGDPCDNGCRATPCASVQNATAALGLLPWRPVSLRPAGVGRGQKQGGGVDARVMRVRVR
jgi:hypothetical protein